MEAAIGVAEGKKADLEKSLADPAVFSNPAETAKLSAQLDRASEEVDKLYARWGVLQSMANG